jgi:hypothetical protein
MRIVCERKESGKGKEVEREKEQSSNNLAGQCKTSATAMHHNGILRVKALSENRIQTIFAS